MSDVVIKVENLSKQYRLGLVGTGTLAHDLNRWWCKMRGKTDPYTKVTETNDRSQRGSSDYVWALKDINFEVKRGEVLGIIGRNGAGKSTLLKLLSRVTAPTIGCAKVKGRIGSLLEVGAGFHPELTGRENTYLNGAILGMSKREVERKFDEIAAFAEIDRFIDTPVKRYSSGMYVRLAFAIAAHLDPEILLVDEVLAVGDAAFQKKCLGKMGDVAGEGRTVLFVSHNMVAVEQLCTRAILLDGHTVVRSGAVEEVIGFYLAGQKNLYRESDGVLARSSSGSLDLIHLCPVNENGDPLPTVQCGRQLRLGLTLHALKEFRRVTFSIGINNVYDIRVTLLHNTISGQPLSLSRGTNHVFCSIPRFPLYTATYFLDVKVIADNEVLIWAPRVETLVITEGDFYNSGKLPNPSWAGMLLLCQNWEVHSAP